MRHEWNSASVVEVVFESMLTEDSEDVGHERQLQNASRKACNPSSFGDCEVHCHDSRSGCRPNSGEGCWLVEAQLLEIAQCRDTAVLRTDRFQQRFVEHDS